jgi:hypothetical protein
MLWVVLPHFILGLSVFIRKDEMDTIERTKTTFVYKTLKPQRLQVDGKVTWYAAGVEIDSKWIHPKQLERMVKMGFIEELKITTIVAEEKTAEKPKAAAPASPVVARK